MKIVVKIVNDFITDEAFNNVVRIDYKSDLGEGINVVADMDSVSFKEDTVVEYVNEFNNKTIKIIKGEEAVKEELNKLFIKNKDVKGYSISYIHDEPNEEMLLRKLGVEEGYRIADKYLVDNGVPLDDYVCFNGRRIYLINDEILSSINKKILSSTKYEKWMGVFNMFYPNDRVDSHISKLFYLKNKEKIDNDLKNYIEKYKSVLNKYIDNPIYFLSIPDDGIAKHSPYYREYIDTRGNIIEVEHMGFYIYVNKNDKTWNIEVPNNVKGLFIGKGGANIKELSRKYGVRINII